MIHASLRDFPAKTSWNLSAMMEEQEIGLITIGRVGFGNDIEIGKGLSLSSLTGKTKPERDEIIDALGKLFQVLKTHATITYQNQGWDGEGFYIENNSRIPIFVGEEYLHSGRGKMALRGRTDLHFGLYGPVVFQSDRKKPEKLS